MIQDSEIFQLHFTMFYEKIMWPSVVYDFEDSPSLRKYASQMSMMY